MKKKLLCALLCAVIGLLPLYGCGDSVTKYSDVSIDGAQNTDYVVYSNGGSAVQYGNYVYFLNGTRGYDDTDGKSNQWGSVVKGALYRAELNGEKDGREFVSARDDATGIEFKSAKGLDYDENVVDVVKVQSVAPITVGTSGYTTGGIYIFDNYVYYASPNSEKNKVGEVQSSKTDFFFSRLDGKDNKRFYSTKSDSSSSPYGFYRQNGGVYMVVLDGTDIVSVFIKNGKVENVLKIAEKVTAAYFPTKPVYDAKNNDTNAPEDFVYFTRAIEKSDKLQSGNVMEMMRPNGKERVIIQETGTTVSIDSVRDGLLFYRVTNNLDVTEVRYDNLHETMMANSPSYKAAQDKLGTLDKNEQENGVAISALGSSLTGTYACRPNGKSNSVYYLYADGSGITLVENNGADITVYGGSATISFVDGNYVYFTESGSTNLYRTNMFVAASDKSDEEKKEELVGSSRTSTGLIPDVCAGYLVYFGQWDEWASGYTLFKKLNGLEGEEPVKVGLRIKADLKTEA